MDVEKGAKRFYIAGDSNIELGLLCTGDDEDEELYDMYGRNVGKDAIPTWEGFRN